ncbi:MULTISPECIES: ribosome modulation factor [Sphingomonadaceae]|jgi:ribosome modulation factor|uniref:ribosome modulation factor n=1 Tax=Sphingomonadaceae TaxID=41297 RepID=UPI0003157DC4|nr:MULTISPECIES: hypothetical protein [Sphingomonadaceae]MBF7013214.1 hypothetical protein [Novosphingobium sp. HR1a]WJM27940.1 hypothetical protein QUC32_26680 [Novosphingobium resinovorum]
MSRTLSNVQRAHFWGIKAAQAGIPLSSNPYASPQQRAAWEAGYRHDPFAQDRRHSLPN